MASTALPAKRPSYADLPKAMEYQALKIVVLHGAGAYGRVMAPAAVLARQFGYDTVAPVLPGYGLTRVPRARMTYPLRVDRVSDLIDAEPARDGKPVALFGDGADPKKQKPT